MSNYLLNLARRGAGLPPIAAQAAAAVAPAPMGPLPAGELEVVDAQAAASPVEATAPMVQNVAPQAPSPTVIHTAAPTPVMPPITIAAAPAPVVQRMPDSAAPVAQPVITQPLLPPVVEAGALPIPAAAPSVPEAMRERMLPGGDPLPGAVMPVTSRVEHVSELRTTHVQIAEPVAPLQPEMTVPMRTIEVIEPMPAERNEAPVVQPAELPVIAPTLPQAESLPLPVLPPLRDAVREERGIELEIGTIEIHAPTPAATPVAAPPAAPAQPAFASGFEEFAQLRSYARWEW